MKKEKPRWKRHKLAAEHGEPECVYETIDIGPFTIDVYEDGTWDLEGGTGAYGYDRGRRKGTMASAKVEALTRAHDLVTVWREQLLQLVSEKT